MKYVIGAGVVALVLVVIVATASRGRSDQADVAGSPTAAATVTVSQLVVGPDDLSGCTIDREGEFVVGEASRSFDCPPDDRLTLNVWFRKDEQTAAAGHHAAWGTMDGAKENIARTIAVRPVRQDSLKVANVSAGFGKLGADSESIYCATYTDPTGATTFTHYFGSFQYKTVHVQYTSWANSGGGCEGASRALQGAQRLATKQLEKLRAVSPR